MNSELLKIHNERFHAQTGYKCFMCGEYFDTNEDLLSHEPEHMNSWFIPAKHFFFILDSIFQFNRIDLE